jgi:hypothetical protein
MKSRENANVVMPKDVVKNFVSEILLLRFGAIHWDSLGFTAIPVG